MSILLILMISTLVVTSSLAGHSKVNDPFIGQLLAESEDDCGAPEGDGLMFSCEVRHRPIVIAREGDQVTLNCSVSGSRNAVVLWRHNGKTLAHGASRARRLTGSHRPFLRTELLYHTIECATPQDSGIYTCAAFADGVLIRQKTTVLIAESPSSSKKCEAQVAPQIYASTETIFDAPGSKARLTCRANGSPQPKIAWFKRDLQMEYQPVEHRKEGYYVMPNGDLILPSLSLAPIHFAEYKCEATNEHGSDWATTYIQVMPLALERELTELAPVPNDIDMLVSGKSNDAEAFQMDDLLLLDKLSRNRRSLLDVRLKN